LHRTFLESAQKILKSKLRTLVSLSVVAGIGVVWFAGQEVGAMQTRGVTASQMQDLVDAAGTGNSKLDVDTAAWNTALGGISSDYAVARTPEGPFVQAPIRGSVSDLDGDGPSVISLIDPQRSAISQVVLLHVNNRSMAVAKIYGDTTNLYPVETVEAKAPQGVTDLKGKYRSGRGNVTVKWKPVANDGGSPVVGYQVMHSHNREAWKTLPSVPVSEAKTTYDTQVPGEHIFLVRAYNGFEEGSWQQVVVKVSKN